MRPAVNGETQNGILSLDLPKTKVFIFWYILSPINDALKEEE